MPQRPHWWDQFQIYRRTDLLRFSKQNDRRELWRTQKDFFLTCLGFMVGVGHTMRFPAKVYQHGGGVFFIPYFFSLIFFGLPLVFLHLSLGQYTGQAANTAFSKLMPIGSGELKKAYLSCPGPARVLDTIFQNSIFYPIFRIFQRKSQIFEN